MCLETLISSYWEAPLKINIRNMYVHIYMPIFCIVVM